MEARSSHHALLASSMSQGGGKRRGGLAMLGPLHARPNKTSAPLSQNKPGLAFGALFSHFGRRLVEF
jgi:hypothetical protein